MTTSPSKLLFLPGASGNTESWRPAAERLAHPAQQVHIGWPGFGSTPPDSGVTGMADLVASVLPEIDQPIVQMGNAEARRSANPTRGTGMLKHLLAVLGMTLALTGCQTQQEKLHQYQLRGYNAHCMTSLPRGQCVKGSSAHVRACEVEQAIIKSCAGFVTSEVSYMVARGDQPQTAMPSAPAPRFTPTKPEPIIIDVDVKNDPAERYMAGDEIEWRIAVNPGYPAAYLQAAEKAEQLTIYMLESYEKTVRFHLRQPSSTPKSSVLKRIARLEALRAPLSEAAAAGEAMQAFYGNPANRSRTVFDELTDELVQRLNAHDPILQKAAELARQQQSPGREFQAWAEQVRIGVVKFQFALSLASKPLDQIFEDSIAKHQQALQEQREWEAWARRSAEQQREKRRAQGGDCSCAGGNVCFGPRGGRFCITSGGNKRYGI
ncbi:hypothetical protein SAMN05216229_102138 [Geopseudomonas sagittaria]|uniref:Uncharacterized protein n=1 Tax=Geopseudomonas sagittaria TaxID=1135990 RepID=A0A1I5Q1G6_9GAMM|nr:hypothetical protein [Pseudomonas sagittaria]SFP39880.1 hypothetical protein SAMN05216229_102138 [Pseudomonas sagittaria]